MPQRAIAFLTAAVVSTAASQAAAQAQRTVEIVSVDPGIVEALTATVVTAVAHVSVDTSLIRASVTLTRYDEVGRAIGAPGVMNDDGHSGDAVAGDGRFTLRFTLTEQARRATTLRASAAYRGTILRVQSRPHPLYVAVTEPASAARTGLATLMRAGNRSAAYAGLGERLNEAQVLSLFSANDLTQLAGALETCTVATTTPDLEVCVAPVIEDGQSRLLRIIMVRDVLGSWRVLGW